MSAFGRRLRMLVALLATFAAATVAHAEVVRVAIARGASFELAGGALSVRTAADDFGAPVGEALHVAQVGPFASDGERLAATLFVSDESGGAIRLGGSVLAGPVEIVATETGLVAVDVVELETYVASVVGAEMIASWPKAALEAQAVAARTYVLKKQASATNPAWDVEATVLHQVYRGVATIDARTRAAAEATRGQVLVHDDALADAFFFASCAGRTESGAAAFGRGASYLKPASCSGSEGAPNLSWTRRWTLAELSLRLAKQGVVHGALKDVTVSSRTSTGRAARIRLSTKRGGKQLSAAEFRRALGYTELPSLDFRVQRKGGALVFSGRGAGHGVGLCQWCARGRAAAGDSAETILARYYPGTELRQWY